MPSQSSAIDTPWFFRHDIPSTVLFGYHDLEFPSGLTAVRQLTTTLNPIEQPDPTSLIVRNAPDPLSFGLDPPYSLRMHGVFWFSRFIARNSISDLVHHIQTTTMAEAFESSIDWADRAIRSSMIWSVDSRSILNMPSLDGIEQFIRLEYLHLQRLRQQSGQMYVYGQEPLVTPGRFQRYSEWGDMRPFPRYLH